MKFGPVDLAEAEGAILAHSVALPSGRLRKGHVLEAGDVTTAKDILLHEKIHLVVTDVMLPDINGNVVCETVRSKPDMADTKIIVISGMIDDAEVTRVKAAGADEFVQKPFDIETLVDRISELVGV